MRKTRNFRSGIFTPRVLVAFALCSFGILLGAFSFAATPPAKTTHASASAAPDPAKFLSTGGSNANRLPPGVPLPPSGLDAPPGRKPGTQSSVNNGDVPKIVEKRVVLLRQIGHDLLWKKQTKTQENTLEKQIQSLA